MTMFYIYSFSLICVLFVIVLTILEVIFLLNPSGYHKIFTQIPNET